MFEWIFDYSLYVNNFAHIVSLFLEIFPREVKNIILTWREAPGMILNPREVRLKGTENKHSSQGRGVTPISASRCGWGQEWGVEVDRWGGRRGRWGVGGQIEGSMRDGLSRGPDGSGARNGALGPDGVGWGQMGGVGCR